MKPPRTRCYSCAKKLTAETAYAHPTSRSGLQSRCRLCDKFARSYGVRELAMRIAKKIPLTLAARGGDRRKREAVKWTRDERGELVRVGES